MNAEDELGGVIGVRAFATGGRVHRTGLALVHEGEWIVPAPGSEAAVEAVAGMGAAATASFHFPLEVEVIGTLGDRHKRELAEYVFAELDTALREQGG